MHLKALKSSVAQGLFIRTADENCIAARWRGANARQTDFSWLALHATEKYLKALLLMMHDGPAKGFGHEGKRRYAKTKDFTGGLLSDRLPKPGRVSSLEADAGHTRVALAELNTGVDRVDLRLERIERRLDLTEQLAG